MNGWYAATGVMARAQGTDLFFRTDTIPIDGRVEYKFWVDSSWILDPLNPRKALGGFGDNSDVWMPKYVSRDIDPRNSSEHGNIDTVWIESKILQRKHPVFIYTSSKASKSVLAPVLYVTDGGDYLTIGRLNLILDSLVAAGRIKPIIAVCVDPRTNLSDGSTNQRMKDYAANDAYLDFLEKEISPYIEKQYPVSRASKDRVIIGASMGGLIATYAALTRPNFWPNCAAQSPAYLQADTAVIKLTEKIMFTPAKISIQTGIIHDTQNEARYVHNLLKKKAAYYMYEEFHEGHNWTNWRTHLPKLLEYFFPAR